MSWSGELVLGAVGYDLEGSTESYRITIHFPGERPPWAFLRDRDRVFVSIEVTGDPSDDWMYMFLAEDEEGTQTGYAFQRDASAVGSVRSGPSE